MINRISRQEIYNLLLLELCEVFLDKPIKSYSWFKNKKIRAVKKYNLAISCIDYKKTGIMKLGSCSQIMNVYWQPSYCDRTLNQDEFFI